MLQARVVPAWTVTVTSAPSRAGVRTFSETDVYGRRRRPINESFNFDEILKAARELPAEDLPALIGQLAQAHATALARLTAPSMAQSEHDELLSVTEAARRLGVSVDYLYSHHSQYPFTRRQGRKLLFSSLGIDKHIKNQRA